MRCFIACWPDKLTRSTLTALSDDVRKRVEHRRVSRPDDLHLTLAFIGDLADDIAVDLSDAVKELRFEPFAWRLDTLGFFNEAGVVWVGAAGEVSEPLANLSDRVRAVLDQMNVAYDPRPLTPHITLVRGVKTFAPEKVEPIAWEINSIALYRSSSIAQASRYEQVKRQRA